jgi:tetratricopeptide (TPR) repeat protein
VQWQFTAGSYAEAAGFRHLTSGGIVDGLADLQTASRLVPYAAKFRQDLATVYAGLATGAGGTAAGPKSVPDPRTFDPTSAETSSRGTLLALAVASLDSAHALQPNLASIDEALGDAYRQWGRPGPALTAYRAAARLSHQNPRYLADQGLALSQAGNPVAALARARAALRLDQHSWFAYYALAKIYLGSHERAQARSAAGFALFWEPPAWPPPPADELRELRSLRNRG